MECWQSAVEFELFLNVFNCLSNNCKKLLQTYIIILIRSSSHTVKIFVWGCIFLLNRLLTLYLFSNQMMLNFPKETIAMYLTCQYFGQDIMSHDYEKHNYTYTYNYNYLITCVWCEWCEWIFNNLNTFRRCLQLWSSKHQLKEYLLEEHCSCLQYSSRDLYNLCSGVVLLLWWIVVAQHFINPFLG